MSKKTETTELTTDELAELTDARIEAKIDQIQAHARELGKQEAELRDQASDLYSKKNRLEKQIMKLQNFLVDRHLNFKVGDVVEDDLGVQYRVHHIQRSDHGYREIKGTRLKPGDVYGIRLTKTGNEAYAKPRVIRSTKPLKKVEV